MKSCVRGGSGDSRGVCRVCTVRLCLEVLVVMHVQLDRSMMVTDDDSILLRDVRQGRLTL